MGYGKYWKSSKRSDSSYGKKQEYQNFRVKSPIKTFRDLEVYKNTTLLVAEIFQIKIPESARALEKEFEILKDIAKPIPKLIAESYGDKFSSIKLALNKLESGVDLDAGPERSSSACRRSGAGRKAVRPCGRPAVPAECQRYRK